MNDRIRYVYKIFDKLNKDKFYIGTTFDVKRRWKQHKKDSNSHKLKTDMLEFGEQDFDIEIIFSGTENEAYAEEIRLIAELKPYYNNPRDTGGKIGDGNIGENNPRAKLVEKDIINICNRIIVNGELVSKVSEDYSQIDKQQIYQIVNGKLWQNIDTPRRKACDIKGENHNKALLKNNDIITICNRVNINGENVTTVAKDYPQVNIHQIYNIVNGKIWKSINAPRRESYGIKGEEHHSAKLCEKDIIDICNRVVVNGELVTIVHKDYSFIHINLLYDIVNGHKWKDVNAPRKKAKISPKRLTSKEALDIRELVKDGFSAEDIQKHIYIDKSINVIKNVINRRTFPNL